VQGALSKIDGVVSAEVNLENQRVVVKHTAETVTPDRLIQTIKDEGFQAQEEATAEEVVEQTD
jgi:copper chaperone CopZ